MSWVTFSVVHSGRTGTEAGPSPGSPASHLPPFLPGRL